jgi:hypothetical protein
LRSSHCEFVWVRNVEGGDQLALCDASKLTNKREDPDQCFLGELMLAAYVTDAGPCVPPETCCGTKGWPKAVLGCRGVHWVAPSNGIRLTGFESPSDWFLSYEYDGGKKSLTYDCAINHLLSRVDSL